MNLHGARSGLSGETDSPLRRGMQLTHSAQSSDGVDSIASSVSEQPILGLVLDVMAEGALRTNKTRKSAMQFSLPDLPYSNDALEPHISAETLAYHHGKHHKTYVDKLNELVDGSKFEGNSLEEIIRASSGTVFDNAAQVWNHTFFWHCLSPDGGGEPSGQTAEAIVSEFGSFADFKQQFTDAGLGTFGSGWVWLVQNPDGGLEIMTTANAETPLTGDSLPLLTCDVWEHAYYIDYRNARDDYLEAFWELANWKFVAGEMR